MYYVYILFDRRTHLPIYVGTTKSPANRYALHKFSLKKINIVPVMACYKKFDNKRDSLREECDTIKYLSGKYTLLNSAMKSDKYVPNLGVRGYIHRVNWVAVPECQKDFLYKAPGWGHCSKIAKSCGFDPERIRQVFERRPNKLHPKIYNAIAKYQKQRK